MNFFEQQNSTRRKTQWLVLFFGLAVLATMVAVYIVVLLIYRGIVQNHSPTEEVLPWLWWNPKLFGYAAGGTLAIILIGSWYKIWELSKGGRVVAEMLGGKPLRSIPPDPSLQRLQNVVEEMAIASGTPVPEIFVLEETSINAFAAGFSPNDAVIGVTQGTINQLNREELQGVVGHEFSHILNGDMRLNLRLLGLLNGIFLIGMTGYWLLRSTSRRASRKGGGQIVLLGLGLIVVGFVGVFFGRIIQSAISRQREYLADASSVQFTRNPGGLVGALKKIGGISGSFLKHRKAGDVSHLMFGNPLSFSFLFASHPPLEKRIQAIDSSFSISSPEISKTPAAETSPLVSSFQTQRLPSKNFLKEAGKISPQQLVQAQTILSSFPEVVLHQARQPEGARALIYGLLLSLEENQKLPILSHLEKIDPQATALLLTHQNEMTSIPLEKRWTTLNLCLPALRNSSWEEKKILLQGMKDIVSFDQKVQFFEYTLMKMIEQYFKNLQRPSEKPISFYSLHPLGSDCEVLLSCLAYAGHETSDLEAEKTFRKGIQKLNLPQNSIVPRSQCSVQKFHLSLERMAKGSPSLKQRFLESAMQVVEEDEKITWKEAELVRAMAGTMGCPIPPLLA